MKRLTAREIAALERNDDYSRVVRHRLRSDRVRTDESIRLSVREARALGGVRGLEELVRKAIGAMPPGPRGLFLGSLDDVNWRNHEPARKPDMADGAGIPPGSLGRLWAIESLVELKNGPRSAHDLLGKATRSSVQGRQLKQLEREGVVERHRGGRQIAPRLMTPLESRYRQRLEVADHDVAALEAVRDEIHADENLGKDAATVLGSTAKVLIARAEKEAKG